MDKYTTTDSLKDSDEETGNHDDPVTVRAHQKVDSSSSSSADDSARSGSKFYGGVNVGAGAALAAERAPRAGDSSSSSARLDVPRGTIVGASMMITQLELERGGLVNPLSLMNGSSPDGDDGEQSD